MKRIISILLGLSMIVTLAACQNANERVSKNKISHSISSKEEVAAVTENKEEATVNTETKNTDEKTKDSNQFEDTGKILIVFFSWSGNTRKMAEYMQKRTGGDMYEIVATNPYPEDYNECTEVALDEQKNNERPKIVNLPDDISEYSTIMIGYPIWWHTAPMIVGTFLENYDLKGIDIYPFSQSASMDEEQFKESMEFVKTSATGAIIHNGLFVNEDDTDVISDYLEENALNR